MNNEDFKNFIQLLKNYKNECPEEGEVIGIPLDDNKYSKNNTLKILKHSDIEISNVKKIVSLNAQGHLVVDNGILADHIFLSKQPLEKEDRDFFKEDQFLFVQDKNNENNILVYKILFNQGAGDVPELKKFGEITSTAFDEIFNAILFKEEESNLEKIKQLISITSPKIDNEYEVENGDKVSKLSKDDVIKIVENILEKNDQLNPDDYIIYLNRNNELIMESVGSGHKKFVIAKHYQNFLNNNILYLQKEENSDDNRPSWKILRIPLKFTGRSSGKVYFRFNFDLKPLENKESGGNLSECLEIEALLALVNNKESEFTYDKYETNSGIDFYFQEEQKNAIEYLKSAPDQPSEFLDFEDEDDVFTKLKNYSGETVYSLEITDDNELIIKELTSSSQSKIIISQKLSTENINHWRANKKEEDPKILYFSKNEINFAQAWYVKTDERGKKLLKFKKFEISKLREQFKMFLSLGNNALHLIPSPTNKSSLHPGNDHDSVISQEDRRPVITKTPNVKPAQQPPQRVVKKSDPAMVDDVINLQWNPNENTWQLDTKYGSQKISKTIEFREDKNEILKNLINKNDNQETVILFNKLDGQFLMAYYISDTGQRINCSHILENEEKHLLSSINEEAREKVCEQKGMSADELASEAAVEVAKAALEAANSAVEVAEAADKAVKAADKQAKIADKAANSAYKAANKALEVLIAADKAAKAADKAAKAADKAAYKALTKAANKALTKAAVEAAKAADKAANKALTKAVKAADKAANKALEAAEKIEQWAEKKQQVAANKQQVAANKQQVAEASAAAQEWLEETKHWAEAVKPAQQSKEWVEWVEKVQKRAKTAQQVAEKAQKEAEKAQKEAEKAQKEAEKAQKEAEKVQLKANGAQEEATKVKKQAEEAKKWADNISTTSHLQHSDPASNDETIEVTSYGAFIWAVVRKCWRMILGKEKDSYNVKMSKPPTTSTLDGTNDTTFPDKYRKLNEDEELQGEDIADKSNQEALSEKQSDSSALRTRSSSM